MNSIIEAQEEYFNQFFWPQSLIGLPMHRHRDPQRQKKDMEDCIWRNKQLRSIREAKLWDDKIADEKKSLTSQTPRKRHQA